VKWISVWSSLMFRSVIRALAAAISGVLAYTCIPVILVIFVETHRSWFNFAESGTNWGLVFLISSSPFLFLL
jgi:hypothetical protein